jgi:hypothetical protein
MFAAAAAVAVVAVIRTNAELAEVRQQLERSYIAGSKLSEELFELRKERT